MDVHVTCFNRVKKQSEICNGKNYNSTSSFEGTLFQNMAKKNDAKASLLSGWLAWTDCAPRHLASAANDIDDSAVLKSLSYSALTCLDMEYLESLATQCRLDLEFRGCNGTKQSLQYSSWTVSLSRPGQLPLRNQDADSEATKDSQYLIFKQNGWQLKRSTASAKKVGCPHTISNHICASLTVQSHMHNYTHTYHGYSENLPSVLHDP